MLVAFAARQELGDKGTVVAEDHMDDGTPIRLAVTIDATTRSAHFDFTGTGPEVFVNTNAPPAVTYSAVIYAMRCMVQEEIPLNQVRLPSQALTWLQGLCAALWVACSRCLICLAPARIQPQCALAAILRMPGICTCEGACRAA